MIKTALGDPKEMWKRLGIGGGQTGEFGAVARVSCEMIEREGDNYLAYILRNLFREIWEKGIFPNLDKPLFIRFSLATEKSFNSWNDMEIYARGVIQEVEERPIVYKFVDSLSQLPRDVFKCEWCGGYTKNDKRGHCAGCGGPRGDKYLEELPYA